MAIYSFNQEVLCRIEVRFSPGIPKIEILGSSSKISRDAAVKAKLLLQQQGFRFPRGKKIFVCIDPFLPSHTGLDLAIYMAMKHALQEEKKDFFVYGDLHFNGQTFSDKTYKDLAPYIPNQMQYLLGGKNIFSSYTWAAKTKSQSILYNEILSPIFLAILKAKSSLLLLETDTSLDEVLKDLQIAYFQMHKEIRRAHPQLQSNKKLRGVPLLASASLCPCRNLQKWERQSCSKTKKICLAYMDQLKKYKFDYVFVVDSAYSFQLKEVSFELPLVQTSAADFKSVLMYVPQDKQKSSYQTLFEASKHYKNLLGNSL
jgi:hypothetical protein